MVEIIKKKTLSNGNKKIFPQNYIPFYKQNINKEK